MFVVVHKARNNTVLSSMRKTQTYIKLSFSIRKLATSNINISGNVTI
ncbi:hypothetical protein HMPREF3232_01037 [Fannyhessea vaginae]|nr:hypothetical protein HMPREF3232_01037 [Fannyhessea vaginae]